MTVELWDAYDREGSRTGGTLVRGKPVPEGLYHLVCEVIVRHADGRILLMRRDAGKATHPGEWEATAGGSALRGESPEECIRRELYEETGIRGRDFRFVNRAVSEGSRCLFWVFSCTTDCAPDSVTLQAGETMDYRWVEPAELRALLDSPDFVQSTRERKRKYLEWELGFRL